MTRMSGNSQRIDAARATLDVERIRADFPALRQTVHGRALVYLDNAASAQKPAQVIDTVRRYYTDDYANVHRGLHYLSERASDAFEAARGKVRGFINAREDHEIVFVRGTTEAINLVAASLGQSHLKAGDEILITEMEHHSNIVPWQLLGERLGTVLKVAPVNDAGELLMDEFERLLGPRTRLVAVTHVSNALGTINPVERIIELAHARGARVLIDGAQSVPHAAVDVQALGCDFYAFSGHKLYGPTGIGVLYGRRELLESMPPYQGGGEMIREVSFARTTYAELPHKFEAGTPHIVGAIGLGAAIDYLQGIGLEAIARHEDELLAYATTRLQEIRGLRLVGTAAHKAGIASFLLDGVHTHDVGTILDRHGVAVRAGHHCAMPLMTRFGVSGTTRASFALYNTRAEIDVLVEAIRHAQELFGR
ncbi:MAG: cysteine desulfurase [Gammaproteobacteria bacterium]|nr:cysteine desulfurase [Gammaproteobacteria bacterium]